MMCIMYNISSLFFCRCPDENNVILYYSQRGLRLSPYRLLRPHHVVRYVYVYIVFIYLRHRQRIVSGGGSAFRRRSYRARRSDRPGRARLRRHGVPGRTQPCGKFCHAMTAVVEQCQPPIRFLKITERMIRNMNVTII